MSGVEEVPAYLDGLAYDPVGATNGYGAGAEPGVICVMEMVLRLPRAEWVEQRTFGDRERMSVHSFAHSLIR